MAGGMLAMALGSFSMWEGATYAVGTARRMGPGWFPVALGILLLALGLLLVIWSLRRGSVMAEPKAENEPLDLRGLAAVSAGIAAFALSLERFGLIPAVFSLVLFSSLAAGPLRLLRLVGLATVISLLAWLVFRLGLGLPLPAIIWPR